MNKEEYYKRIEKLNNRFKTDRVSADEEYHLVCQKNYLSTKYIEHLQQGINHLDEVNCRLRRKIGQLEEQCKKQKKVITKIKMELIENEILDELPFDVSERICDLFDEVSK